MPATPELWRDLGQVNLIDGSNGTVSNSAIDDQFDPKVVHLSNGNILIAWVSNSDLGAGSSDSTDIIGRLYNSRGEPIGGEFLMNGFVADSEDEFDIAATTNGGFVMAYVDDDDNTADQQSIRIAEFTNTGFRTSDVELAGDNGDAQLYANPEIAVSGNTVLVTYESRGGTNDESVQSRTYNLSTNAVGAENIVFQSIGAGPDTVSDHSVTTLSNGGFVVVVGDDESPDDDIRIQVFNSSGVEVGGLLTGPGADDEKNDPHVIGLTGGGFVVAYETAPTTGTDARIIFQRYDNMGVAQGGLTLVTVSNNEQLNPAVAALSDGGFVVAWTDTAADDIIGRRYDSTGNLVGSQFTIDSNVGAVTSDLDIEAMDDGRFVVTWEESTFTGNITIPQLFPLPPIIIPTYDTDIRARIYDPRDAANSNVYDNNQRIGTIGSDTISVISTDDNIFAFNGNDTLDFNFNTDLTAGDNFDGGFGIDTLRFTTANTFEVNNVNLTSFERIEIGSAAGGTVQVGADQIGDGLSSSTEVQGTLGPIDTFRVVMETATAVTLSGFTFADWATGDIIEIVGDLSSETMVGSSQRDRIFGNFGNDTLNGGGENDILDGGASNDLLIGGTGADSLIGGSGTDTSSYITATADLVADLQFNGFNTGDAFGDTYSSVENLTGSNFRDILRGDSGDNVIVGLGGVDLLLGRNGDDTLIGNDDNDSLFGQNGNDIMAGGNGNDTMHGGAGSDVHNGGAGTRDVASYQFAAATGLTVDLLVTGNNTGEAIGDTYIGVEDLNGSQGDDNLRATDGNNLVRGLTGNDTAFLRGGNDAFFGSAGNDLVFGQDGNDAMVGQAGRDTYAGGAGADIYRIDTISHSSGANADTILDFNRIEGDTIDLSRVDANGAAAGNGVFNFIGSSAFSGTRGELRFEAQPVSGVIVQADVNGDGITDMSINVNLVGSMLASDFDL